MNEIAKTPLKTMPIRQVPNVKALLINDNARQQLAAVAAKHMNPERMMRVVANAIRTTPKLEQCEPLSFLGALMQCAAIGLEPNTILGHAYLIPFDNKKKNVTEVQLVIGYKGLIDLARRSGHITAISANVHYEDDELWIYEEGTEATLRHRPGPQNGKPMHAYAIAKFTDGGHAYVVLPWSHVMKIRDGSQGWQTAVRYGRTDQSPWKTHVDAMAKKTAIRALSKYLPLSVEFADALGVDDKPMDYRAFAMAPDMGSAPMADQDDPIEAEAVNLETGEVTQQTETSRGDAAGGKQDPDPSDEEAKKKAAFEVAEAKRKKDRAEALAKENAARERAEAAAKEKAEAERMAARQREAEQQAESEPDWSQNGWAKGFLRDVEDMGFDSAMDLHAADLERMKDDPARAGLHAYCMAEGTRIGG